MTWPPSDSSSFELLDERIRRWIWNQGWETLRPSQEKAIPLILAGDRDVVISAPTSLGKTEAAFLPILTRVLAAPEPSVQVLYISPLKALINDQFSRLEYLCEALDIPVHRWHGDVSGAAKARLLKSPGGVLLITPESLEAVLMRQGSRVTALFRRLGYVVVDELHSYIGNERGAQLQSLLHRVDAEIGRTVPRIGLSATLSQPELAAHFLRKSGGLPFEIVEDGARSDIRAQLRAFRRAWVPPVPVAPPAPSVPVDDDEPEDVDDGSDLDPPLVEFLLKATRGQSNLIFCNRKRDVEELSDALRERARQTGLPDAYCAHHGNLSREIREHVEALLKSMQQPTTCVCTSTLEMGIDIGPIQTVVQLDPPPSVASLRQRVGRSGRRGEAAILRIISREKELTAGSHLCDRLRLEMVRSIACLALMADGWCEPPDDEALHFSTLVQQTLSVIAQRGGATISHLYRLLVRDGPFGAVSQTEYLTLLRALAEKEILVQMEDGTVLHGPLGERIAGHFSFYAAFQTPEEYRLLGSGRQIGTLPVTFPLKEGDPLLFAGRRWKIVTIDDQRRVIHLAPGRGRRPPRFDSTIGRVHPMVRLRMFEVLCGDDTPAFLDPTAAALLAEAREAFREEELSRRLLLSHRGETLIFHWDGDLAASTLRLLLQRANLRAAPPADFLSCDAEVADVRKALAGIVAQPLPAAEELAAAISTKCREKHDGRLPESLLLAECARRDIDLPGAIALARRLAESP